MRVSRRTVALLILALLPRLVAALVIGAELRFSDEAGYIDAARSLLAGQGFGRYPGVPAYPVLLATLSALWPTSVAWTRLAQGALCALGAGLTFTLARRLDGRTAASWTALLYALDPLLVITAALLYPEAPAAVGVLALVLCALEAARGNSLYRSGAAGALLGVLALLRPVALTMVPVVAIWVPLNVADRAARRAAHALTIVVVCAVVIAPWTVRNYRVYGKWIPVTLVGTRSAGATRAEVDRRGLTAAIFAELASAPASSAQRMAREFGHFWELAPARLATDDPVKRGALHRRDPRLPTNPIFPRALRDWVSVAVSGLELLLGMIGVVLIWHRRPRETALLTGVLLVYALGYSLFVGKMRYRIPVMPLVFVFAGVATGTLADRLRGGRGPTGEPDASGAT